MPDTPCCPEGYQLVQYSDGTFRCIGMGQEVRPIPCLDCNCAEPIPRVCLDCEDNDRTIAISFSFNPFIKQCTDCEKQNHVTLDDCKANAFAPYFLLDPIINFILE